MCMYMEYARLECGPFPKCMLFILPHVYCSLVVNLSDIEQISGIKCGLYMYGIASCHSCASCLSCSLVTAIDCLRCTTWNARY